MAVKVEKADSTRFIQCNPRTCDAECPACRTLNAHQRWVGGSWLMRQALLGPDFLRLMDSMCGCIRIGEPVWVGV
jgi:hypothetical protein